jgi:hypothetical protein
MGSVAPLRYLSGAHQERTTTTLPANQSAIVHLIAVTSLRPLSLWAMCQSPGAVELRETPWASFDVAIGPAWPHSPALGKSVQAGDLLGWTFDY